MPVQAWAQPQGHPKAQAKGARWGAPRPAARTGAAPPVATGGSSVMSIVRIAGLPAVGAGVAEGAGVGGSALAVGGDAWATEDSAACVGKRCVTRAAATRMPARATSSPTATGRMGKPRPGKGGACVTSTAAARIVLPVAGGGTLLGRDGGASLMARADERSAAVLSPSAMAALRLLTVFSACCARKAATPAAVVASIRLGHGILDGSLEV